MAIELEVQGRIMNYFTEVLEYIKDESRRRGVLDDGVLGKYYSNVLIGFLSYAILLFIRICTMGFNYLSNV